MSKVAIIQSNYIPWKGYFDIINDVDLFIFYDDVQYTKNDWRNRNRINSPQGAQWITIPIGSHNDRLICEIEIENKYWAKKHYNTLQGNYSKAPYYKIYRDFLDYIFFEVHWSSLSQLNQYLIKTISKEFLGIKTEFVNSSDYEKYGNKTERLIDLIKQTKSDVYISGPAAKPYINESLFVQAGIELVIKNYSNYPEYPQLYQPFDHYVTILDLLFNIGPDASYYIWGWREK